MKSDRKGQFLFAAFLALCFLAPSGKCQNSELVRAEESTRRPLNMLVLGDSIMWGQGLRTENKAWYQVELWLTRQTGRPVAERIEAHSGAVIENAATEQSAPADGEVNFAKPTILEEADRALEYYGDGSNVDLVLITGCVNDVSAQNLLNAAIATEKIRSLIEARCGQPMERLLRRITSSFPAAYVVVTGYYPFISTETRNDLFMRAITRRFYKENPGVANLSRKIIFERMIANSAEWYRTSNKTLAGAVRQVNAELGSRESRPRIMFAQINFLSDHSFAAPRTQLWDFNRAPLRKMAVLLSLGRISLNTNDEVRKQRIASCKDFWQRQPVDASMKDKEGKKQSLLCRYAALGHPNRQGALRYANAIEDQLRTVFATTASK